MALVITRRPEQGVTVTVPPSTEETVVHIQTKPKLGSLLQYAIEAPEQVTIMRDELLKISKEGDAA